MKQMKDFVPCYIGCGGTEIEALDYVLARKVFRKFESLNLAYIRDEIDGLCAYMDELFGEENMNESTTSDCMTRAAAISSVRTAALCRRITIPARAIMSPRGILSSRS